MTNNLQQEIIQAIKNFDIKSLNLLLDDDKPYMDVTKERFLKELKKQFKKAKDDGCQSFDDVFFGICEYCNKGCEGMTFLSESGYYLDLFIESKDGTTIDNICVCHKLTNIVDLNKVFNLGLSFGEDEKVSFRPSQEYNLMKQLYKSLKSDLEHINDVIHLDNFTLWYNKFLYLKTTIDAFDLFLCFAFKLYHKVFNTTTKIDKIINIASNAAAATDALIDYHLAKSEREQLIWFFKNESNHYGAASFVLPVNWDATSTILAKVDNRKLSIDISGYEYVIEYFLKIDKLYDEFMEKYKPLPQHYDESANGYVECSLENYLKLHNKHLDIVEKYGSNF